MWNGSFVFSLGTPRLHITNPCTITMYTITFHIVKESLQPILGPEAYKVTQRLELNETNFYNVTPQPDPGSLVDGYSTTWGFYLVSVT